MFFKWNKLLGDYFELQPVELAGRGKSLREPIFDNIHKIDGGHFYTYTFKSSN